MKHPEFNEILDFIENRLTGPDRKKVDAHLLKCAGCSGKKEDALRTLAIMKERSLYDAPEYVIHRAVALFPPRKTSVMDWVLARLEFDSWLAPQAAGIRSAQKDLRQQTYLTDSYKIFIMSEPGQVTGQLIAIHPEAESAGCLVEIMERNKVVNSTTTTKNGEFIVTTPRKKKLQLKIHGDPESILISLR